MIQYAMPALLALIILMAAQSAYAEPIGPGIEHGPNYDRKITRILDDGRAVFGWTSQPQRIQDSMGNWINSKITDTGSELYYQSASISSGIDKANCNLKIYDYGPIRPNESPKITITHTAKTARNGTDTWSIIPVNGNACNVSYQENDGDITVTATRSDIGFIGTGIRFDVVSDVTFGGRLEEKYRLLNNDPLKLDDKFGFTTVFHGSMKIDIDGQTFDTRTVRDAVSITANDLGDRGIRIYDDSGFAISFDPQNYIHDYLWVIKIQHDMVIFDFTYSKGRLPFGQWLEVDPTFTGTPTSEGRVIGDAGGVSVNCATTRNSGDANLIINKDMSANVNGICTAPYFNFDVSSIPSTVVQQDQITSAQIEYDVTGVTNGINCDVKHTAFTAGNDEATYDALTQDSGSVADIKQNDSTCTTIADGKTIVFDTGSYKSRILSDITGDNTVSLGMFYTNPSRDGSDHQTIIRQADMILSITYIATVPPAPTNMSCTGQPYRIGCIWQTTNGTGTTGYYFSTSLTNATGSFTNVTATGNVTAFTKYLGSIGTSYYARVNATNGANGTSSNHYFVTTDSKPTVPLNPYTTPTSGTSIKVNWQNGSSNGGDTVFGFRIEYCITCTSWSLLVNSTSTLNYNHTGIPGGPATTVKYKIAGWNGVGLSPYTANVTGTTFKATTGTVTVSTGTIGDTLQANTTISITHASPSPVTVSALKLYRNGTLQETKVVSVSIANGSSSSNFNAFWNRITSAGVFSYKIHATVSNSTGTVDLASANFTTSREYDPSYFNAIDNPAVEGTVNYTLSRFAGENGIHLKVNRVGGTLGPTWTINCITQTNAEARATVNQSQNWPGTWNNRSGTGYFNGTWSGFRNTPGYVTCFNPPGMLFTTTSYTNSSLALFGIEIFDLSYGSMLGVPVGIFFLALAGGMANKRTAPTWIVVLLGMAGVMATIGFFTLTPIIWGLALVTGLLGLLVNQKVF